jgi:hypothetical protein
MLVVCRRSWRPAKLGVIPEGAIVAYVAARLPAPSETVMGPKSVGAGVFCATVGAVDEKAVMAYIESQPESCKVTAPSEP